MDFAIGGSGGIETAAVRSVSRGQLTRDDAVSAVGEMELRMRRAWRAA